MLPLIITIIHVYIHVQGVSKIYVLVDPNYLPLRELLGEEDSERLLVFVNVPQPTRKLTLQPDSSKEHRQEVGEMNEVWLGG